MKLGGLNPMPIRMGGGRSDVESLYRALRDGLGEGYFTKSTDSVLDKRLRVFARALARAKRFQRHAVHQGIAQLATDGIPTFEQILEISPPGEATLAQRRNVVVGLLAAHGVCSAANVANAVSTALPNVFVAVDVARASQPVYSGTMVSRTVTVTAIAGGLSAGVHRIAIAFVDAADGRSHFEGSQTITLTDGQGVRVQPVDLPSGAVGLAYYLSTSAGALTSLAYVGQGDGGAIDFSAYPSNAPKGGLHHYCVSLSPYSAPKARIAGSMLSVMLPGHATFDVVSADGPFVLGTSSPPGSPLGTGAL